MTSTVIQTEKAPAAIGPYAQGICAGGWLYVSGQIGINPASGELVSADFAQQAQQVLDNLSRVVEAASLGLEDVVAVDVFITDMSRFAVFNQIYERHFGSHRPARAVVEVSGLPRGALLEVKCVAYGT